MIEVYKVLQGHDRVKAEGFLELETGQHVDRTRGHSLRLKKPRHQTYKRNMFFSSRVIDQWNRLPEDIVKGSSINSFKNQIDRSLTKAVNSERGIYQYGQ